MATVLAMMPTPSVLGPSEKAVLLPPKEKNYYEPVIKIRSCSLNAKGDTQVNNCTVAL
jgi:hypothetical protein